MQLLQSELEEAECRNLGGSYYKCTCAAAPIRVIQEAKEAINAIWEGVITNVHAQLLQSELEEAECRNL